ncbi:MAG: hypothetical protein F6K16_18800 [Symploca sp. SIO2B6]|nr:hypothetical protein [Symploca sp. SIO2B6]
MGRWGDGEMGRWGDGEMERNECILQSSQAFPLQSKVDHNLYQGRMLSTLGLIAFCCPFLS